jgi:hypothetical protein
VRASGCGRLKTCAGGQKFQRTAPRRACGTLGAQIFSGNFLHGWWKTSVYVAHSLFLYFTGIVLLGHHRSVQILEPHGLRTPDSRIGRPTPTSQECGHDLFRKPACVRHVDRPETAIISHNFPSLVPRRAKPGRSRE